MAHYLIFGDSITYGEGVLQGDWVQRLRESLTLDDYVFNLGISGDTSDGLLSRFETELKPRLSTEGEPIDQTKVDPIPWDLTLSYTTDLVKQYGVAMKTIAEQENLKFVDLFNDLPTEYIQTLADGVHPDAAGHRLIFNLVRSVLK